MREGDPLGEILAAAVRRENINPSTGDVLVIAQKIVSKSEGRVVRLSSVVPSAGAEAIAARLRIDPRKIEIILRESRRIVRAEWIESAGRGVIICETHHGLVCANAGVDESNLDEPDTVLCLPEDPDASAAKIRADLHQMLGVDLGVILTDSFGRPWRVGLVNVAIGVSGVAAIRDCRGQTDSSGRLLQTTELAVADELAAAAGLLMGKLDRIPAVLVQGFRADAPPGRAADLIRAPGGDLFR